MITGPTAVGKTRLAIKVAKQVPLEIISADSRQMYRKMNIGTGKPTLTQRRIAPHHLVDILDPDESFSAADFAEQAEHTIERIVNKDKFPLVVGGTFLYLKALLFGFFEAPGRSDEIRARLRAEAERFGGERLHKMLLDVDPEAAAAIHPNDHVRLIRALEVYELTGRTVSELRREQPSPGRNIFAGTIFAITMPREALRVNIEERVDEMFALGFVEEVRSLLDAGYDRSLNSFSSLGYRHVADLIHGKLTLSQAVEATKTQTWRYAKKQMSWLKQDWGFEFLNAQDGESNVTKVAEQCKKLLQPVSS